MSAYNAILSSAVAVCHSPGQVSTQCPVDQPSSATVSPCPTALWLHSVSPPAPTPSECHSDTPASHSDTAASHCYSAASHSDTPASHSATSSENSCAQISGQTRFVPRFPHIPRQQPAHHRCTLSGRIGRHQAQVLISAEPAAAAPVPAPSAQRTAASQQTNPAAENRRRRGPSSPN